MASNTKVIIITSDEDLIQEISTRTNANTHIIHLNDQRQMNSTTESNQDLLADLSEINSDIDHVYKRALQSTSTDDLSKTVKISRKSIDSICAVCGGHAVGFNYDVLSCNSCKIFFHRNAYQNLETLKCLTGEKQCSISHEIRRKCTQCRLARCFAVGMRKDFLINEKELALRRKRLAATRNISSDTEILSETINEIDQLMTNVNQDDHLTVDENIDIKEMEEILFETLSVEDWLAIENVRSAFLTVFQKFRMSYSSVDLSSTSSSLITWSHCFSEVALRFIEFYRHIDEFEHLNADDRFTLIKYNLFSIYPISECFNFECNDNYSLYNENEIPELYVQALRLWGASNSMNESVMKILVLLIRLAEGLSMNETETPLNDPLSVTRAQIRFSTLLWNYLINKRGELQANIQMVKLLNMILLIQSETKKFQDLFRLQTSASGSVDQISPLLKSVLHIS